MSASSLKTISTTFSVNIGTVGEAEASINTNQIPPSLLQFFCMFNELVHQKQYPCPEPLLLSSIQLKNGIPCLDVWEHGDVARRRIYSSHDIEKRRQQQQQPATQCSSTMSLKNLTTQQRQQLRIMQQFFARLQCN